MLKNAFRMAKTSLKLLIRSKGFLFIGLIIPIAATLFINLWAQTGTKEPVEPDIVVELSSIDDQIAYISDYNCLAVKVYDRCDSEYSRTLCERLTQAGLFQIFRADCTGCSDEEIELNAKNTALNDKIGAILILSDDNDGMQLYSVGDDNRFELLHEALELCGKAPTVSAENEAVTSYVTVSSYDDVDYYETRQFSYCLAIASLAFILGGVMILNTIIKEKQDHVYSRIMLTSATKGEYILSKALLCVGVSVVQTIVMAVCFEFFVNADIGINVFQFSLMTFLSGVIFSSLAVCMGLYVNSAFGAGLLSFSVWSLSSLLSGTYFDISAASEAYKKIAILMPQRWMLISVQMMMRGDNKAYPLILCVTAAYLTVILVMGVVGLKINEKE